MRNPIATLREEWRNIFKTSAVFAAVLAVSQLLFTSVLAVGLYLQSDEWNGILFGSSLETIALTLALQTPWAALICVAVFSFRPIPSKTRWAAASAFYVTSVVLPSALVGPLSSPSESGSATTLFVSVAIAVLMSAVFTVLYLLPNRRNVAT